MFYRGEMMEDPLPERNEDIPERAERPKKKRREKAKPLEDGLDLSGEFHRGNMSRPSLGNTKEANLAVLGNFKHQEDVKLYGRLPDYDDFQCYDLGQGGILHHVARRIYANIHKPSWGTLKRHLFQANFPRNYCGWLNRLRGMVNYCGWLNRLRGMVSRAISNKNEFFGG